MQKQICLTSTSRKLKNVRALFALFEMRQMTQHASTFCFWNLGQSTKSPEDQKVAFFGYRIYVYIYTYMCVCARINPKITTKTHRFPMLAGSPQLAKIVPCDFSMASHHISQLFSLQGTVYATCTPSKSRGQLSGLKPAMPFQAMPQDLTKAKGNWKKTVKLLFFYSVICFQIVSIVCFF